MRADDPNELLLDFFGLKISAKGMVAVCAIAIPIALLLAALALRIAGGNIDFDQPNSQISQSLDLSPEMQ